VLQTPQSLDHFIGLLTACCQCGGEVTDRVIPVLNPAQQCPVPHRQMEIPWSNSNWALPLARPHMKN
jgi:hypothetical protein